MMGNISTNIKERILKIADIKGLTKEEFLSGINQTYGNYKGKSKISTPNADVIAEISSKHPDIGLRWLLTGNGEMIVNQYDTDQIHANLVNEPEHSYNPKSLPFYDISATASDLHRFHDSKEMPDGFIQFPGVEECDFAIPVYGDSMSPEINSGDYVAVKIIEERSFLNYGVKYLIITEEQRLVKYLHAHEKDDNLLILRSANSQHQDIVIEKRLILKFYLIHFIFKREV